MNEYEGKEPLPVPLPFYKKLTGPADTVQDSYERFFLPQIQLLEVLAVKLMLDFDNDGIPVSAHERERVVIL